MPDRTTTQASKHRLASALIPLLRPIFRYSPVALGKQALWDRLIGPHLEWRFHPFTAKTLFGSKMSGNSLDLVARYVYYFGVWEPNITNWLSGRLRPGDTFIDVGANIGYFSLLASRLVGDTGRVVAIEASPEIYRVLENNISQNGLRNVRSVHAAVWNKVDVLKFYSLPECATGNSTTKESWAAKRHLDRVCEVPASVLPTILRPEEVRTARLIKIDVEGAEFEVATGMASMLQSCRHDLEIILEVTPSALAAAGRTSENLLEIFSNCGFHAYSIKNDYMACSYIEPGLASKPQRIRDSIMTEQTDVILSRIDSESL